ncbi:MAG: Eco57I restriction-modification methylase domain-containing protein, partial [Raineya sp.]|nr:Eco57I restriction-modification methylase domain-containing protein [Raineya sp.]
MNLSVFYQNQLSLFEASTQLFEQLGIQLNSNTAQPLPIEEILQEYYKDNDTFQAVQHTYFMGILEDSALQTTQKLFPQSYSFETAAAQANQRYDGLMLFALELHRYPTRTEISEITRAFNRKSRKMPVGVLFKYPDKENPSNFLLTLAFSERFKYLQSWRAGEKVGKVIMLRDVDTQQPHAGHLRILQDLRKTSDIATYEALHKRWLEVLDVNILNKKFFQELSHWYFTAIQEVHFPEDLIKNPEIRNATNLIRLITRIIFIWFIKEKNLVPAQLFEPKFLASILKDFCTKESSHNYYNAILQNLFFATLNQKVSERRFAEEGDFTTNQKEYGVKNLFRYAEAFTIPKDEVLKLFHQVPFLNGGLFDCLDKPNEEGKILYVDGFSRNPKKKAIVPDRLFFEKERKVDLNPIYDTRNVTYVTRGLIHILNSYKFTITENTPLEEEVALDPELLGKVFENLLAYYNPETQTTARKQTGSFYTPREIVDYMVQEALKEYLKQQVGQKKEDFEERLQQLFQDDITENPLHEEETKEVIEALHRCKIFDPACGSGAFPMGVLLKMVYLLQKLDPQNHYWKELQRNKAIQETEKTFHICDKEERSRRLEEINDIFENNTSDYGRKLYLIENCIYGVDIQPIAVQIAKLRFFISLVIEQKVDRSKDNFGIRSLPNLETKFVAANTLIALDKPQQLPLRNARIDELEEQLKQLRHQYFTANTRKQKLELQQEDKQIRKEIARLLKADGWESRAIEQISSFDLYDQNQAAEWFDPEWMFGIQDGFDIVIGNPPYVQLQKDNGKLAQIYQNCSFQTFVRTGDIYLLFYEKGIELLKQQGHLIYITSNKWMRAAYGEKLRKFFLQYNPKKLIDLGSGVFENATVDTNILLIQKDSNSYALQAADLSHAHAFKEAILQANFVSLNWLNADIWMICSNAEQRIKEKIEKLGKPLKEWNVQIYRGVLTGYNEAFIIDGKKRAELLAQDPKSEEIIKPLLRGRDIKRYHAQWQDLWLINTHNGIKELGIPRINVEKDYPVIYKHLLQYEEQLKKRQDKGDHWTNLRNCAYLQEFEKEKIVWQELTQGAEFDYDKDKFFVSNTAYILTGKNLKYILGYLNSKFNEITYKKWYSTTLGGKGIRWLNQHVVNIPIPTITLQNEMVISKIERLVDKIIISNDNHKNTDITL